MQRTLSAQNHARRQRHRWPLGTVRDSTRFDVVDQSGETLAARLPLSEARQFRDQWNVCQPHRQAAVRVSEAVPATRKADPSEDDIAVLTAEIRREWSAKEERGRRVVKTPRWEVPEVADVFR